MLNPKFTIRTLQDLIRTKRISADEVITYYHTRLERHTQTLNCAIELFDRTSLAPHTPQAGALAGIPGLIKDNICQNARGASAGSLMLKNYKATYDATVVSRLKNAGAVSLGRANMDEFGMGSSGEHSAYGPTKNPWNLAYSPGGSSSGSAAAVAAGLVPWALGTETGGSVRQPAAFCGLVGLYPTYGRFSRSGLIAFCSSFDQAGPLTKTVYDNALIASQLSGKDPKDATSLALDPQDFTAGLAPTLPAGTRIGVLKESLESDGVDERIKKSFQEAIASLEKMGATIEYISMPLLMQYGISVYFVLSRAEAASNLSRYDGTLYGTRIPEHTLKDMYITTRHDSFGKEVQRRIMMGNFVLSAGYKDAYYTKAQEVRDMIRAEYNEAFKRVDALISPTTATLPFKLGDTVHDPLAVYMADCFTVPNCITGLPAISIPCGFSDGFPIGFQFMGPAYSEAHLYKLAYAFEQAHDYHTQYPAAFMDDL